MSEVCLARLFLHLTTLAPTKARARAVRQQLIATSEIPKLNALRRVTRIVTDTAKEAERVNQPDPSGQEARLARRRDSGEPVG